MQIESIKLEVINGQPTMRIVALNTLVPVKPDEFNSFDTEMDVMGKLFSDAMRAYIEDKKSKGETIHD